MTPATAPITLPMLRESVTRWMTEHREERAKPTSTSSLIANVRLSSGRNSLVLVRPDGSYQAVWDSSSSYLASISPTGDSITAVVQRPDGTQESRLLSSRTGRGRKILRTGDYAGGWSNDGKSLVDEYRSGGRVRLGSEVTPGPAQLVLITNLNRGIRRIRGEGR